MRRQKVIRARDLNWERFLSSLEASLGASELRLGELEEAELRWASAWAGLVASLVEDNREAFGGESAAQATAPFQ